MSVDLAFSMHIHLIIASVPAYEFSYNTVIQVILFETDVRVRVFFRIKNIGAIGGNPPVRLSDFMMTASNADAGYFIKTIVCKLNHICQTPTTRVQLEGIP